MDQHKIIAYITGSEIAEDMDLSQVTHVNYAFGCPAVPDLWVHTDYEKASPLLDYINVMGYDYNWPTLGSSHI